MVNRIDDYFIIYMSDKIFYCCFVLSYNIFIVLFIPSPITDSMPLSGGRGKGKVRYE